MLNKIDLLEVEERREEFEAALTQHMGHTRYVSATSRAPVRFSVFDCSVAAALDEVVVHVGVANG